MPDAANEHGLKPSPIVVINDSPLLLRVLCRLLERAGYETRGFRDAASALEAMDPGMPPALIVTDINMPGIDGWRFCRLLRSSDFSPFNEVPIIVASATFAGDAPAAISRDLDADAFLGFPVDAGELLDTVRKLLGQGRRVQKPFAWVLDPDAAWAETLVAAFRENGYDAVAAASGEHLLLTEIPERLDVAVLAEELIREPPGDASLDRLLGACPDLIWFVTTTDASPATPRNIAWLRHGAAGFVHKPFAPAYMIELCAKARKERAFFRAEALLEERTVRLQESEARFRALFFQSPDAAVLVADQRVLDCNPAFIRLMRTSRNQALNLPFAEFFPEHQPEAAGIPKQAVVEEICAIASRKRPVRREWRMVRRDGEEFWAELSLTPIRVKGRKVLHARIRDVSERRKMARALARGNEFQRFLLEISTEFINVSPEEQDRRIQESLERTGQFLGVDRAYLFKYDFARGIAVNTHEWCAPGIPAEIDNLQAVPLETVPEWVAVHERGDLIHIPDVSGLPEEGELRRILEGQGIRSLISVPLMDGGECLGFVGFDSVRAVRDWTKLEIRLLRVLGQLYTNMELRRRAEAERKRLERNLENARRMESVGRLAGGIAHDFNNMLNVILGSVELLQEELPPDSPLRELAQEIQEAGQRSAALTRQLLAFARKQTVNQQVLDVNHHLEATIGILRRLIGEDIEVSWKPGPGPLPVYIDSGQLDQILMNLAVNARHAIQGVGTLAIETGMVRIDASFVPEGPADEPDPPAPGDYVVITVSDTGCGMDEETLAHVFEPFFTTRKVGEGAGLGLATVYGIVKQNHGFIRVSSEKGRGTTFRIYLPRHDARGESQAPAERPRRPAAAGPKTDVVLVVEDEPWVLNTVRAMLERLGYPVLAAGSPEEGVKLAEQHAGEISLLLTDVIMPEMNGRDLAARIGAICPNLKVIFMSGYPDGVLPGEGALPDGSVVFLSKPFQMKDLEEALQQLFRRGSSGDSPAPGPAPDRSSG